MPAKSTFQREMACHCGWCGAVRQLDGTWDHGCGTVHAELITHGICPGCAAEFRAGVEFNRRPLPSSPIPVFAPQESAA